ncbi:rCG40892 [Rattus norvegicus]|uniref:RCG40892 n=1 Tax=Rattus norvegicus TaxID=10116 RepID=A6KKW7_RAT|nr:rCG40892 [Rattus norvegicus]
MEGAAYWLAQPASLENPGPPAHEWQPFSSCGLQLLCQDSISIQNSGKINCEMEMKITLWLGAGSPQHEELS